MKTWNAPEVQELDVRLTADGSKAGTSEEHNGYVTDDGFVYSTYNEATSEINYTYDADGNIINSCISDIKSLTS